MKTLFIPVKSFAFVILALLLSGGPVAVFAQQESSVSSSAAQVQSATININTASAEEIAATLTGIGLTKAQAIVAWRDDNGAFTRIEQLLEVKGIGQATLDRNVSRISL